MNESAVTTLISSMVEKGGIAAGLIGVITLCVVILWKYVGAAMLQLAKEIAQSNQAAMADLKAATQNSKDTAAANLAATGINNNATDKLTTALQQLNKDH